mmetsp:Transcript_1758/g.5565  ORF Transcript_1758/g.5565 Transcript_1758/m.5565 type:complete len:373 (-) Transcript_1758:38-1156(-)
MMGCPHVCTRKSGRKRQQHCCECGSFASASKQELQDVCLSPQHFGQVWAGLVDQPQRTGHEGIPHVQLPVAHRVVEVVVVLPVVVLEVEQVALERAALVLVFHLGDVSVHVCDRLLDKFQEGSLDLPRWNLVRRHPIKHFRRMVCNGDRVVHVFSKQVLNFRPVADYCPAKLGGEGQQPVSLECRRVDAGCDHVPGQQLTKVLLILQCHLKLEPPGHRHALRHALAPGLADAVGEGLAALAREQRLRRQRHGPLHVGLVRHAIRLPHRRLRRRGRPGRGLRRGEGQAAALEAHLHGALAGHIAAQHAGEVGLEAHSVESVCDLCLAATLLQLEVGLLQRRVLLCAGIDPGLAKRALVLELLVGTKVCHCPDP